MISQTVFVSLGYVTHIVLIVSVGMFVYSYRESLNNANFGFKKK